MLSIRLRRTQHQLNRYVKEDLKTIFFHLSLAIRNNFRLNQSLSCLSADRDAGKNTDCTALSVIFARPTGLKINTLNKIVVIRAGCT
jgi:hypothetical protein